TKSRGFGAYQDQVLRPQGFGRLAGVDTDCVLAIEIVQPDTMVLQLLQGCPTSQNIHWLPGSRDTSGEGAADRAGTGNTDAHNILPVQNG
ncbi:hypothetical protein Q4595_19810, partial [Wenyingzhuangia sp. 1_MG-2023]|nr:hypothetical protein [Wenyingzhuangia sp. 1_MG-2023]